MHKYKQMSDDAIQMINLGLNHFWSLDKKKSLKVNALKKKKKLKFSQIPFKMFLSLDYSGVEGIFDSGHFITDNLAHICGPYWVRVHKSWGSYIWLRKSVSSLKIFIWMENTLISKTPGTNPMEQCHYMKAAQVPGTVLALCLHYCVGSSLRCYKAHSCLTFKEQRTWTKG